MFGEDDGGRDTVSLSFDTAGPLIAVDVLRRGLDGIHAQRAFAAATGAVAALGDPSVRAGDPTSEYLSSGPMHTATLRYSFSNHVASMTASNLPSGIVLHENYQSASPPPKS